MKRILQLAGISLLAFVVVALLVFRPRLTITRSVELAGPAETPVEMLLSSGQLRDIQQAVELSGKTVDELTYEDESLLYRAAREQQLDVAEWLLAEGATPNGSDPSKAPLRIAIANKDIPMIKLLVKWGADPDLAPESGVSPRGVAKIIGNPEIIEALQPPPSSTEQMQQP